MRKALAILLPLVAAQSTAKVSPTSTVSEPVVSVSTTTVPPPLILTSRASKATTVRDVTTTTRPVKVTLSKIDTALFGGDDLAVGSGFDLRESSSLPFEPMFGDVNNDGFMNGNEAMMGMNMDQAMEEQRTMTSNMIESMNNFISNTLDDPEGGDGIHIGFISNSNSNSHTDFTTANGEVVSMTNTMEQINNEPPEVHSFFIRLKSPPVILLPPLPFSNQGVCQEETYQFCR
jgi:hypothetical protein